MIEAIDDEAILRARQVHHAEAAGGGILGDRRRELREAWIAPPEDRQILRFGFRDDGARVRAGGLRNRRIRIQRNRLRQRRVAQPQLDLQALRRHEDDVVLTTAGEPVVFDGDLIAARRNGRERKAAVIVAARLAVDARVGVGQRDAGVAEDFTCIGSDASPDLSGATLCVCRRATEQCDEKQQCGNHAFDLLNTYATL